MTNLCLSCVELPVMSLSVKEETVNSALGKKNIICPLERGTNLTIKWYKNGVHISSTSSQTGGPQILSYVREHGTSVVGIYQCFATNSVGSDYATTRLVEIGNFICIIICVTDHCLFLF